MLMSEAIRLGAMLRPKCETFLYDHDGSCAIGAALEALSYNVEALRDGAINWRAELGHFWAVEEITRRNDKCGHTREAIADWLVESGNDFEVSPLPKIEVELSPADVAAIQEVTR